MGTKEHQEWIKKNGLRHTSMSVGDVAALGDRFFVVAPIGWKEIK
jgi:hypothetical protein